jgi:hypothetical protein
MDFGRANLLTTNRLHWLPFFLDFLSFEDRTNRALLTALIYVKALFVGIYATPPALCDVPGAPGKNQGIGSTLRKMQTAGGMS